MTEVRCPSCGRTTMVEEESTLPSSDAYRCGACSTVLDVHRTTGVDYMLFDQYQTASHETALPICSTLSYAPLKLCEEAGEVAGKIGKLMRDQSVSTWEEIPDGKRQALVKELGDCLWYIAEIATQLDVSLSAVAVGNIVKLRGRQLRGTIQGDGDDR